VALVGKATHSVLALLLAFDAGNFLFRLTATFSLLAFITLNYINKYISTKQKFD